MKEKVYKIALKGADWKISPYRGVAVGAKSEATKTAGGEKDNDTAKQPRRITKGNEFVGR